LNLSGIFAVIISVLLATTVVEGFEVITAAFMNIAIF
jgi:hypothetical protein